MSNFESPVSMISPGKNHGSFSSMVWECITLTQKINIVVPLWFKIMLKSAEVNSSKPQCYLVFSENPKKPLRKKELPGVIRVGGIFFCLLKMKKE